MVNWLYTTLGIGVLAVAFVVSLLFEEAREFYSDQLGGVYEGIIYLISFEWVGDVGDLFSAGFEGIGDFSIIGLAFGISSVILIFFLREYTLNPFLQYYTPVARIFWMIVTYVGVFVAGYIIGRILENTG